MKQQLLDAFKTAGNLTMNKTVLERLMQLEDTFQQDSQFTMVFLLKSHTSDIVFVYILEICRRMRHVHYMAKETHYM